MSEWISVKDRLPTNIKDVLFYTDSSLCIETGWFDCDDTFNWFTHDDVYLQSCVTHWQPLPKPPKDTP